MGEIILYILQMKLILRPASHHVDLSPEDDDAFPSLDINDGANLNNINQIKNHMNKKTNMVDEQTCNEVIFQGARDYPENMWDTFGLLNFYWAKRAFSPKGKIFNNMRNLMESECHGIFNNGSNVIGACRLSFLRFYCRKHCVFRGVFLIPKTFETQVIQMVAEWGVFCVGACMLKTLERYQKCNYGAPEPTMPSKEILISKTWQCSPSQPTFFGHFLGEDLGPLNSKQLEQLEMQLESSVRQIRSTRIQQMLDQLSDLQRKEQVLVEKNRDLRRKYEETQQANHQRVWEANAHAQAAAGYGQQPPQQQGNGFFHPLECQPTLQMGYHSEQITLAAPGATTRSSIVDKRIFNHHEFES
ncbi:hypothetical protein QJS10_CPA10g01623 [Acorus calamus]|uniref:K-box domain-containing protein n=1 Tax=Acorus calamus TaxID=4465 RepID=A0AAV9E1X4_ACOCL|nr:hypothetical protein QJS10_CPA10g01623 [Acorus calamus]